MSAAPTPAPSKPKVLAGWKKLLARLAGVLLRAWTFTLRFTVSESSLQLVRAHEGPTLFILWHENLFLAADFSRRYRGARPLQALISASGDGAWLAEFFASIGLGAVRGSSSRGGKEAATALIRALRAGHDVGITPDGPRGPARQVKPGALVVARQGRVRIVVLGVHYEKSWRLPSWDRLHIPQPFSQVRMVFTELRPETLTAPDALAQMQQTLNTYNADQAHEPTPHQT